MEALVKAKYLILVFIQINSDSVVFESDNQIIAPADGRVVVIEEVHEGEYFKDKRIQVSIFMSPINVHVTRYAISGIVKFSKYYYNFYQSGKIILVRLS